MSFHFTQSVLALAVTLGMAAAAQADPFINVQVLGSTSYSPTGTGYSSILNVTPGQTVYYELVATLGNAGTVNTTHSPSFVIGSSQTAADGLNGMGLKLTDAQNATMSLGTFQNGFGDNVSLGAGQSLSGQVLAVDALRNTSSFIDMTAGLQILTGSIVAGNTSGDTLSLAIPSGNGFTARINLTVGDQAFNGQLNNTSDHYVGFTNLTLSETPAPGVVPALGVFAAGMGLLGICRRRRMA